MVRQRTTFQLDSLEAIDTDNLVLNEDEVSVPGSVFNRRQDRVTLEFDELPQQFQQVFDKFYEINLQWTGSKSKPDLLFQNYQSRGFSAYLIPADANYEPLFDEFGSFLNETFNIGFNYLNLVSQPNSASFHSSVDLKTSILQKFMRDLTKSVDLTLFIDDIRIVWKDRKLVLTWTSPPNESIIKKSDITKEISFFQTNDLSSDLEISGIRTVLSNENHLPPTKTLLFVKPRHHSIEHTFNFELQEPIGLHPTLKISNFNNLTSPNPEQCELFLYSIIEKSLIFDKYQFDTKTLSLINSWGDNDLEAPIWKINDFGSIQLFQVNNYNNDFELKYHSRYLKPDDPNTFKLITPQLFWACYASAYVEDYEQIAQNPFDFAGLGFESLFEDTAIFYHYDNDKSTLDYSIPTGAKDDFTAIQMTTLISITLGTFYIIKKLFSSLFGSTTSTTPTRPKESKKAK